MSSYVIPVFVAAIIIFGCIKKVHVFDEFTLGAKENITVAIGILPTLVAMLTGIGMLRASGAFELLEKLFQPLTELLAFPRECLPLALIRPISGSGALAVFESILKDVHPDSFAGRVASVILGSTETTFYTIAVYYGAVGIKKQRYTLAASLTADFTGFIFSVLTVRIIFGM